MNEVVVYAGSNGKLVEIGDTVRINAEGFHNGTGFGVELPRTVSFSVSDSTVVRLEGTAWFGSDIPTIRARGLRAGLITLAANINGISGSDSLRVIPAVRSVLLSPNPASIKVNDTITIQVTVVGQDGADITTVQPFVTLDPDGIALFIAGRNRLVGYKPGTTTVRAIAGRVTGTSTLTVLP